MIVFYQYTNQTNNTKINIDNFFIYQKIAKYYTYQSCMKKII